MTLEFYDYQGQPFSYCEDGETIYPYAGIPIAYIYEDSIYSFNGRHLGFFENGQIWDHSGKVILFTPQATGGPIKPLRGLKPLKSL